MYNLTNFTNEYSHHNFLFSVQWFRTVSKKKLDPWGKPPTKYFFKKNNLKHRVKKRPQIIAIK